MENNVIELFLTNDLLLLLVFISFFLTYLTIAKGFSLLKRHKLKKFLENNKDVKIVTFDKEGIPVIFEKNGEKRIY